MRYKYFFLNLLLFINSTFSVEFKHYPGHPFDNQVKDIHIDDDTIWIAMEYRHVIKLDVNGNILRRYTMSDGLVWYEVRTVEVDKQGNKWFGTGHGLSKFDGMSWTTYDESSGLNYSNVISIAIDSLYNFWCSSLDAYKLVDTIFIGYDILTPGYHCEVKSIVVDSDNNIWFGTWGEGLAKYDGTNWESYDTSNGMFTNHILSMDVDREKNVWIGTQSLSNDYPIIKFDGINWTKFNLPNIDTLATSVYSVAVDSDNNKWFGTWRYGVFKYDDTNWVRYDSVGLLYNPVMAIGFDSNGNKWFGTKMGLSKFDGNNWSNHIFGLGTNGITAITIDSAGTKWFATGDIGLIKYHSSNNWTLFTMSDGLINSRMVTMEIDSDGNNWIGTMYGLTRFNGASCVNYDTSDGLSSNNIRSIAFDSIENVWVGTTNGLNKYDGNQWTIYDTSDGLVSNTIVSTAIDLEGNKWFGTPNGVCTFDGVNWISYDTSSGLPSNYINTIAIDSYGNKWFGTTNSGICKYDNNNWTVYDTSNGLSSNRILSIETDNKGQVWVGTISGGVSLFDGNDWIIYDSLDGLGGNDIVDIAFEPNGNVWFAVGSKGVTEMLLAVDLKGKSIKPSNLTITNYPNPFKASTIISFEIPVKQKVEVNIYTLQGKLIKTIFVGLKEAGKCSVKLEGSNLPCGTYFCVIKLGTIGIFTKKIIHIK